jgi:hypothetical protein
MSLGNKITITNKTQLDEFKANLDQAFKEHKRLDVKIEALGDRTDLQNKSLHKYCELVAEALNDRQFTCNNFFKNDHGVRFTKDIVKNELWRPIQIAVTGEQSSKRPSRAQYGEIYDTLNAKLAEYGIQVDWPTK